MNNDKTGGPAFPVPQGGDSMAGDDGKTWYQFPGSPGMSLREYFAAAAMQGWMSSFGPGEGVIVERVAALAFNVADAMLAERDRP